MLYTALMIFLCFRIIQMIVEAISMNDRYKHNMRVIRLIDRIEKYLDEKGGK